jgi:AhpD family alkylhydroperoxidase
MTIDYVQYANDVDAGVADVFKAAPGPMRAYAQLVAEATKDGALDAKVKELMAVAISISIRCEGCIAYHTRAAHKKGATRAELLETIAVAVEMGGGPSTVYGANALAAYDQFAG